MPTQARRKTARVKLTQLLFLFGVCTVILFGVHVHDPALFLPAESHPALFTTSSPLLETRSTALPAFQAASSNQTPRFGSAQIEEKTLPPRRKPPDVKDHIDTITNIPQSFISSHSRMATDRKVTTIGASSDAPFANATKLSPAVTVVRREPPRSNLVQGQAGTPDQDQAPINLRGLGGSRWPYFVHFHKAGGTTLCHQARSVNGMNVPLRNCNLPGDGPRTLEEGLAGDGNVGLSCDARVDYLRKHCIHFFAAERWLDASLCPDRFLYITVLREPVRRIESNCRFELIQPADAMRWLTEATCLKRCPRGHEDTRVSVGTAAVDNFYVRSLGGPEVFHRPVGGVTLGDLEDAKRRLLLFEVVLVLEEFEAGLVQLEQLLGWEAPTNKKDAHRSFGAGDTSIAFTADQRQIVAEKNRPDMLLYAFAVDRSKAISAAILQNRGSRRLSLAQPPPQISPSTRTWPVVLGAVNATAVSRRDRTGDPHARRLLARPRAKPPSNAAPQLQELTLQEPPLPQTPPFVTWKEAYTARTTKSERSSCQARFKKWEQQAKREKESWLRKREAAASERRKQAKL